MSPREQNKNPFTKFRVLESKPMFGSLNTFNDRYLESNCCPAFSVIVRKSDVSIGLVRIHTHSLIIQMAAVSVYDISLDHRFIGLPTTHNAPITRQFECFSAVVLFSSLLLYWLMWKSDLISATSHAGWFFFWYVFERWDMGEWSISIKICRRFNWKEKRRKISIRNHHLDSDVGISTSFFLWKICCIS